MDFTQIISQFGFPILACIAMGWYVKYITDQNRDQIDSLSKSHAEETEKMTAAINNNTIALTRLCEKLQEEKE